MPESLASIRAVYALVPPVVVFDLRGRGVNHTVIGLQTGMGDVVVKTYHAARPLAHIAAEHQLLHWLAQQPLPFAVPAPLATTTGATIAGDPGDWYALFPVLPGTPGSAAIAAQIEAAGHTLGLFHRVLQHDLTAPRTAVGTFGALAHIHPQVPHPPALFDPPPGAAWAVPDAVQQWWHHELQALDAFVAHDYPALPTQLIHGDFTLGNLLFAGSTVTAVLDFEFALQDVRAMDLATLVLSSLGSQPGAALPACVARLSHAYGRQLPLTEAERHAFPWLLRLWLAVNLIWRIGSDRAAGDSPLRQLPRVNRARALATWLEDHAAAVTDAMAC